MRSKYGGNETLNDCAGIGGGLGRRRDWLRRILEEMIRRIGWEREEEEVREGNKEGRGDENKGGKEIGK